METKPCAKCKEVKALTEFYTVTRRNGSPHSYCRACMAELQRERRKKTGYYERAKGYLKEWHAKHPDASGKYAKGWREKNPDKYKAQYTERNKTEKRKVSKQRYYESEKCKENKKQYFEAHRDELLAVNRQYYKEHKDTIGERAARWRKENRERKNISERSRSAAKKANGGKFTVDEWIALCVKYDNRCLACKARVVLTADHVIPLSKGGTNDIENIQPLCVSCNSSKGTKTIDYR
jgi:5-methylcytosine-specific restriction endonuclease McrA